MLFEQRVLTPYGEPVHESALIVGEIYFSVKFVDDDMLVPIMETLVFIGRNIEPGDKDRVYFQDVESYNDGVRLGTVEPDRVNQEEEFASVSPLFYKQSADQLAHIFEFERALDQLMKCSLRRRSLAVNSE